VASGVLSVQAGKPAPQQEKAEPSRGRPTVEGLFYKLAVIADHRFGNMRRWTLLLTADEHARRTPLGRSWTLLLPADDLNGFKSLL
jgi:hypothetical protein